jgi:hypothetical protein
MAKSSEKPAIPRLDDFNDFVAERDKLREIAKEFNEATVELADHEAILRNFRRARDKQIDEAAQDRVENKQLPSLVRITDRRDELQSKIDVLRRAVEMQTDVYEEVKGRRALDILLATKPLFEAHLRQIFDAMLALDAALRAEEDLRGSLVAGGVIGAHSAPPGWLRWASQLRNKIGSGRDWSSLLNRFGRDLHGAETWHRKNPL